MKIYNTLTHKIEEFIPNEVGKVKMYTCGPTVYHYAHIGNLRTYISEDILEKTLKYLGYEVIRCMNITDVGHNVGDGDSGEDKMVVASKREHKSVYDIAKYYTDVFKSDCSKLNIRWHELSGRNPEDLMVAVREDIEKDTAKKNPFDFVLWFTKSKFENQEMQWDSPWGRGYPGWHIECSGISIKYLGEYLDIHCGAEDAVFPHHTNEIAQSEAYLDHKWCNYWVHLGFLNDLNGKMSKSKGEFLTVSLLEEKGYNPLVYRYLCLKSYYHNTLTFSYDILDGARNEYNKLKNKIKSITLNDESIQKDKYEEYNNKFMEALSNDLNTSMAITILYDVLKSEINNNTKIELIKSFDEVLSLDLLKEDIVLIDQDLEKYILDKIEERNIAKENKDYVLADHIREELLKSGIVIKDTREGTIYNIEKK